MATVSIVGLTILALGFISTTTGARTRTVRIPERQVHHTVRIIHSSETNTALNSSLPDLAQLLNDSSKTETGDEDSIENSISLPLATFFAFIFVALVVSVPVVVHCSSTEKFTRIHLLESGGLLVWLLGAIYLFTNVIHFQSAHFNDVRSLTLVETVYLLAQVVTTVGYGDIIPAFPQGQVLVAFYVLAALVFSGGIVMEALEVVTEHVKNTAKIAAQKIGKLPEKKEIVSGTYCRRKFSRALPLVNWRAETIPISYKDLCKSIGCFVFVVFIGVLFWHFCPGEDKTWLQAIYMSIITLSTVGFGAFTANTQGGMVFAAFWMVIGVGTLACVVGNSIETLLQIKAADRYNHSEEKIRFYELLEKHTKLEAKGTKAKALDKYQFLLFGLRLTNAATEEDILKIESRFQGLLELEAKQANILPSKSPSKGDRVSGQTIKEYERPPASVTGVASARFDSARS